MIKAMSAVLPASTFLSFKTGAVSSASMSAMDAIDLQSYMKPDARDYIHVPIRALSAAPVQGGVLDFSHKNGLALKTAVNLFNGLTIFKDHNLSVDTWLGKTSAAYWDECTPGVPQGVNMMLDVDTKADPKTARGLISGALDSGSVTIKFNYEQSHPNMDEMEFMMNLGATVDGEVVRALVTEIVRCMEYSVVWQGADVFAKVIGEDGKIYTPGIASNSATLNSSQENNMNWTKLAQQLGLNIGNDVTEETLLSALKSQNLNVTAMAAMQTELTDVNTKLTTAETKLTAAETQVSELTSSVNKVTTDLAASMSQVTALTTKVTELTPKAEIGDKFMVETRSEALRLYNLVEGEKATDAMRSIIGNATLEVAKSFITSYTDRANQIAPMKCVDCGSANLSRATAKQTSEMPGVDDATTNPHQAERLKATLASLHGK